MGREGGPSAEEMGLKPEETRVLSDAELIKGGARTVEGGRLEVTKVQIAKAKAEMDVALAEAESRAEEMRSTYPELAKNLDDIIDLDEAMVQQAEGQLTFATTDEKRTEIQAKLQTLKFYRERSLKARDAFLKGI